jgi:MoaA/NifB/PqqE/SkfB family radical SAM enzyme
MANVETIDFHVTSECNQECPYCWGPQGFDRPVDTATAGAIVRRVAELGIRRIVFTGGDPLKRPDIGRLLVLAREAGLEVALSTTGDELSRPFLEEVGEAIDLISLPLDGASEETSARTKKPGHFGAVLGDLDLLADFPAIDVKVATPVTRHNLAEVPAIVRLLGERAGRMPNRFFYNVFQAFPRAMSEVDWDALVVTDAEFDELRRSVEAEPHSFPIHWLDHRTLDRLYVMIFPDGSLTVPVGGEYLDYGPFLEVTDLEALLERTDFDAPKHRRHAQGWRRVGAGRPA